MENKNITFGSEHESNDPIEAPLIIPLANKNISINPDESKDQFGDELFEQLIINFVEKDYEEKKTQIEEAVIAKDSANLYYIVHTFKTTARMLCIEDFAKECEVIQEFSFKGREDWDKLKIYVPQFLKDFQTVYEDAKNIYDKEYKPKPAEIMEDLPEKTNYGSSVNKKHSCKSLKYLNNSNNNINNQTDEEINEEEMSERISKIIYNINFKEMVLIPKIQK
jgi:hypothetical protein